MKIIGKYFYMKNYFFHKEIGSLCKFNTYILTQNGFYVFHNLNIHTLYVSLCFLYNKENVYITSTKNQLIEKRKPNLAIKKDSKVRQLNKSLAVIYNCKTFIIYS